MTYSPVRRLASILTWIIAPLSLFLLLVVVPALLAQAPGASDFVRNLADSATLGAGRVWAASVLVAIALTIQSGLMVLWSSLRSWGRATVLALGALAIGATWAAGVRPPTTREGVFRGTYAVHPLDFSADMFFPCEDPAKPLPRGAQLGWAGSRDTFLVVAVRPPGRGWHGSHPSDWPDTYSDVHGVKYYLVQLRGRLTGPGQYGWPPAAQYKLKVDSVVSMRPRSRRQRECD